MRQRIVLGLLGALLMYVVEVLSMAVLFFYSTLLRYILFPVVMLGSDFLMFARNDLGWPIPSDERGELPFTWIRGLITLNLVCYTALGFFLGWMLGRRLSLAPKPR